MIEKIFTGCLGCLGAIAIGIAAFSITFLAFRILMAIIYAMFGG